MPALLEQLASSTRRPTGVRPAGILLRVFKTSRPHLSSRHILSPRLPFLLLTLAYLFFFAQTGKTEALEKAEEGLSREAAKTAPSTHSDSNKEHDAPTESTVSLDALLEYADQHAPALLLSRSQRALSKARKTGASSLLPANPELDLGLGARKNRSGSGLEVDVGLSQAFSLGGKRRSRLNEAQAFADLSETQIEHVRWLVHCDVHAAYHVALIEQERLELARRVVEFQEEVLGIVERQISVGEAAPLSLRLAQAEVAQARQVLLNTEQSLLAARLRLAQLSGWPIGTPPKPEGAAQVPSELPQRGQLTELAFRHLPSLKAASLRIEQARAQLQVAKAEAWPDPALGVAYHREDAGSSDGPSNVFMGTLSLPIPSFQLNQGERSQALAEIEVAEAELQAARIEIEGEVAKALSEVLAASQRSRAYGSQILPRFEENLHLLRRSFELGEIDLLALSTGRERFLQIQSDALAAQLDTFVALARLERVVGVDLWFDLPGEK